MTPRRGEDAEFLRTRTEGAWDAERGDEDVDRPQRSQRDPGGQDDEEERGRSRGPHAETGGWTGARGDDEDDEPSGRRSHESSRGAEWTEPDVYEDPRDGGRADWTGRRSGEELREDTGPRSTRRDRNRDAGERLGPRRPRSDRDYEV